MWALRCLYELHDWNEAAFVTLTYNDEHLPKDYSVKPEHLRKFIKGLRYDLSLQGRTCKYFACGEYGSKQLKYLSPGAKKCHGRPHYHLIIFGLNPWNDKDRQLVIDNWKLCDVWMFDKNRPDKEQAIDEVNITDIAYVTGYVKKKLNGELAKEFYGEALKPFQRISHGIGLTFAMENKERLLDNGFTFIKGKQRIGIPRYFRQKFNVDNAELLNKTEKKTCKYYFEQEQSALMKLFYHDMKKKGFSLENDYMREFRFKQWIENYQFTLASQVQKDFEKRSKMYSKL